MMLFLATNFAVSNFNAKVYHILIQYFVVQKEESKMGYKKEILSGSMILK